MPTLFTGRKFDRDEPDECAKGIAYGAVMGNAPYSISCIRDEHWRAGGCPGCDAYEAMTEAQVAAKEAARERSMRLLANNLSSCCEAEIDASQVIPSGRHKGHGPRFCSKCRRVVLWV